MLTLFLDTEPEHFIGWLRNLTVGATWKHFSARLGERYPIDPRDADFVEKLRGVRGQDNRILVLNTSAAWWDMENEFKCTARPITFEAEVRVVRYLRHGTHFLDTSDDLDSKDPEAYQVVGGVSLGEVLSFYLTRRSPGRLQVEIEWQHYTLAGYMTRLLTRLAEAYPEVKDTIQAYIATPLDALPSIVPEVNFYSCFIAYGEPDAPLARKLHKDLQAQGVSCWLYDTDATVGQRTWKEIGRSRRETERMVVGCSAKSLVRDGVLKEIEEQIDEDPNKIVPISLDDLWKEKGFRVMRGVRDLKPFLLDKNYADFANLPYDKALERLKRGLSRRDAEISRR